MNYYEELWKGNLGEFDPFSFSIKREPEIPFIHIPSLPDAPFVRYDMKKFSLDTMQEALYEYMISKKDLPHNEFMQIKLEHVRRQLKRQEIWH